MIRYDSEYLTCTQKLMDSQLSLYMESNRKLTKKCNKNKPMSVIRPVQSSGPRGQSRGYKSLIEKDMLQKVGFEPGVKE